MSLRVKNKIVVRTLSVVVPGELVENGLRPALRRGAQLKHGTAALGVARVKISSPRRSTVQIALRVEDQLVAEGHGPLGAVVPETVDYFEAGCQGGTRQHHTKGNMRRPLAKKNGNVVSHR